MFHVCMILVFLSLKFYNSKSDLATSPRLSPFLNFPHNYDLMNWSWLTYKWKLIAKQFKSAPYFQSRINIFLTFFQAQCLVHAGGDTVQITYLPPIEKIVKTWDGTIFSWAIFVRKLKFLQRKSTF
jgi:hypothetical protein